MSTVSVCKNTGYVEHPRSGDADTAGRIMAPAAAMGMTATEVERTDVQAVCVLGNEITERVREEPQIGGYQGIPLLPSLKLADGEPESVEGPNVPLRVALAGAILAAIARPCATSTVFQRPNAGYSRRASMPRSNMLSVPRGGAYGPASTRGVLN